MRRTQSKHLSSPTRAPAFLALALLAVLWGAAQATRLAWINDDAYISFRYARNLIRGLGLVFNPGERVEGYSNFLWTIWCALGMRLGIAPESWAIASGVACFAVTLILLGVFTWQRRTATLLPIPIAALAMAAHHDAAVYATSGLEGSLFTMLALAGYLALLQAPRGARWAALGGVLLALATLTRPDGALFTVAGGAFVLWQGRPRARASLAYAAVAALVLVPYAAWKVATYGDLFPNTYYAKSAMLAWWDQGLAYVGAYFAQYWPLGLAVVLAGWAALSRPRATSTSEDATSSDPAWSRAAALAAAMGLPYVAYVARVGGDFMYARLLIPATPFLAILLELALERVPSRRTLPRLLLAALAIVGIACTPSPMRAGHGVHGITDERAYYQAIDRGAARRDCEELRRYFEGLPVRAAIVGTQAIVAYYADLPVAIEASAGLTDSFVAHQPIVKRGWPGHEKPAPWRYLIERRRVHVFLASSAAIAETLSAYIPVVPVRFGDHFGFLLTWDPAVTPELVRRGAETPDFLTGLDERIRRMPSLSDSTVRADYERVHRFYFANASDPARERPFLERLGMKAGAAPPSGPAPGHATE